jgi:CIC family chloride channel protein
MVAMAILIGLLGGFGAVGIQYLIKLIQKIFWGNWEFSLDYVISLPVYMKILVPTTGGLLVGIIVYFFASEAKGHGVPEVMASIALRSGIIRPRVVLGKLLASALCIGTGGSVGREGPVIQIGSAIGSSVGQFTRVNSNRMKIFVACGAAAGIAAAFNAPVAGALFSVEVILGDFGVAQFSPIVIAAVVATVVSRTFLGDFPAFVVPKYELVSPNELFFYAILGLIAGFIALLYIKVLYKFEDFFEDLKIPGVLKTVIGGLLIGIMGIFIPNIYGVGYNSMDMALHGQMIWTTMLMLVFVKILATSITLGSGGSGGIFAPSLFIGTMTGGFFGALIHQYIPNTASSGAYALVGMGALVAGATHAPITAILIIFEMTNDYKIILPLMISCVIATLLTTKIQRESIYTLKLIRRGVNLFRGREVNILRSLPVKEIMQTKPAVIPARTNFNELMNLLMESSHTQFFVTDSAGHLSGSISIQDVRRALAHEEYLSNLLIAQDLVDPHIARLNPEDTLDTAMKLFGQYGSDEIPIVDSKDENKIIGSVRYRDIISAYNRELIKKDMLQELGSSIKLLEKTQTLSFLPGHSMAEIPVPLSFVDKSIKQLNVRLKYGVNIVMIKRRGEDGSETEIVPHPEEVIHMGDVLIAMGKTKDLEMLRNR